MIFGELDVLECIESSIEEDQDLWPEFALTKVKITSVETGELMSLLAAHSNAPVRVEGYLDEVAYEHSNLVKCANHRRKLLRIDDVATYSFSQWDDGSLGFWAAGRAGWYEIRGATQKYEHVYRSMEEATGMFYYLADRYKNSRSYRVKDTVKTQDAHVRSLMSGYLKNQYNRREDSDDVIEGFYEHRRFLLKSMLEGQEGLNWGSSPILRHLKKKFPTDFAELQKVVSNISMSGTIGDLSTSSNHGKEDNSSEGGDLPMDCLENDHRVAKRHSLLRPKTGKAAKTYRQNYQRKTLRGSRAEDQLSSDNDEDRDLYKTAQFESSAKSKPPTEGKHFAEGLPLAKEVVSNLPLPVYYEPRGPGDSWTCPYDGCSHTIWKARSVESVELIKRHFLNTHVNSTEELINSESRPWVSVGRLLDRVKGFATAKIEAAHPLSPQQTLGRVRRRY